MKTLRKIAGQAMIGSLIGIGAVIGLVTGAIFWVQAQVAPVAAQTQQNTLDIAVIKNDINAIKQNTEQNIQQNEKLIRAMEAVLGRTLK